MKTLNTLHNYRSYIYGSIGRDLRLRYRGSALGAALLFIVPAFQIALYVLVFGNLLKGRLPGNATVYGYSIYLCSGILFWNFFSELLQRTQGLYLENANLLKKVALPPGALSVVNLAVHSINLALALALLLLFLALTGALPGWPLGWLIPVWLTLGVLALAIGQCMAILQVFFRDFGTLTTLALQALFWGTPLVYPLSILPAWLLPWLQLNPLVAPIGTAQALMLGTPVPHWHAWASTAFVSLGALLLGRRLYRHHHADLMDNL